ncbi:MAG: M67 family metallopeptidase [Bacteroidetes bacterium SB0662_bin_6]|nr:M67 family metallopeptidase [Bacteroidetes bacterium SB0668_bin_1]MYE05518.1 M67 family metallopeptidase [Bacteroidetes bacterium SB0662_bin_6]
MQTQADVLDYIRRHGEETYPEECCGFLIGRLHADGNEAVYARRAVNRNENRREDRYVIAPGEYLEADLAARRENLDIVGIYHSHPDHPAVPSRTDLELATFPGYSYVIVSVENGKAANLSAWALAEDRSRFLPEEIYAQTASKKS